MDKLTEYRQSLEFQLQLVAEKKRAHAEQKCKHTWQRFKQSISSERTDQQIMQGMVYAKGAAYFIVNGCTTCKEKQLIDLVIEE